MKGLLGEGRAMEVVYLELVKTFDTVSHKIVTDKLSK